MEDSIGKRLYEIRTELQYSQERVAKEIGVSRNTFSDAELGKKPLNDRQVNLFCNTFGINKDYLLYGTQPKYKLEPKDKKALELFRKHVKSRKGHRRKAIEITSRPLRAAFYFITLFCPDK